MRGTLTSSIYSSEPVSYLIGSYHLGLGRLPTARGGFSSSSAALGSAEPPWSNGGQSGSDHLGSDLYGAAARLITPASGLIKLSAAFRAARVGCCVHRVCFAC